MAYCKFQTPCVFCSLKSIEGLGAIRCEKCAELAPTIYHEEKPEQTNENETS